MLRWVLKGYDFSRAENNESILGALAPATARRIEGAESKAASS
jgi:hypothetical protein